METIQSTAAENCSQALHMSCFLQTKCVTASLHPEITGDYQRLLEITGDYWRLLEITRNYWDYRRAPAPPKDSLLGVHTELGFHTGLGIHTGLAVVGNQVGWPISLRECDNL